MDLFLRTVSSHFERAIFRYEKYAGLDVDFSLEILEGLNFPRAL